MSILVCFMHYHLSALQEALAGALERPQVAGTLSFFANGGALWPCSSSQRHARWSQLQLCTRRTLVPGLGSLRRSSTTPCLSAASNISVDAKHGSPNNSSESNDDPGWQLLDKAG